MQIEYVNTKIRNICYDPDKYAASLLRPKTIELLKKLITIIEAAPNLNFFTLPINHKFHLEKLKGKKGNNGYMSLRIDQKYRLEFINSQDYKNTEYIKITTIEIKEASNHYGD